MVFTSTIQELVRHVSPPYTFAPHRTAFVTEEPTAASALLGGNWAKVEMYVIDGIAVEAVLPAALVVNRPRLLELAGGSEIRSAHERAESSGSSRREAAGIVALQPCSGLPMFVDVTLARKSYVVFDSGEGNASVRMRWADLARTLRPVVGVFAEAPGDRICSGLT
jgi:hypothetical protein